jgi:hypothetical protein
MKKIIWIWLIIGLMFLGACTDLTTPTPIEETPTPVVPTPTPTPVVPTPTPIIPTPTPVDPTPIDPLLINVHGIDHVQTIGTFDFPSKNTQQVTVTYDVGNSVTYIGIKLMDFVQRHDVTANALIVASASVEINISYALQSVYLIIGELESNETIHYDSQDIFVARIIDNELRGSIKSPTDLYFRNTNPETAIYYIRYNAVAGRYDHHTSLRAMQGIINRNEPRLLTISTGNPYYRNSDLEWLFVIESKGYDLIELVSLEEVLFYFKEHFEGIITFRDNLKSYNNWVSAESDFALMMASVMNYAPLPFGLQQTMSDLTGLDIIDTFTLNGHEVQGDITAYLSNNNITDAFGVYEHVFNVFKESFNQKSYMSLTSEVMDYAASEKMMFFDLKATQSARDNVLSQAINAYFSQNNDYFNVYGWVDHESSALDFISSYGGIIDVVGNGNLSLLSKLPVPNHVEFKQSSTYTSTYDVTKKYVTFFASESDTIKVGVAFQHGAWLDPNRGKVPINWGLIADMSEEFPFAFDYFYSTATSNDYFYSGGGSAIGFVDIDSQMSLESRNAIADANAYYMGLADQHIIDMYNDLYTPTDVFEKSVLGAYLRRSQAYGAFARMHDGNQTIRVETWNTVPVYNRWTNFYPRRAASGHVSLTALTKINDNRYQQNLDSDYWFIQTTLSNTSAKTGFDLFTQSGGDGYRVYFEAGSVYLAMVIGQDEIILDSRVFNVSNRNIKMIIDRSSPLDDHTRITLYVNDLRVIDWIDHSNYQTSGGMAVFSNDGVQQVFGNLTGTRFSQAQFIYRRITNDLNRFIVAYYGFMGGEDHTMSMYRSEPGINGVISLSPTDVYKIHLMLEASHPGLYQIVNAHEFITYATRYQNYYGTLR